LRRIGYAVSDSENPAGLASIAAPVKDGSGRARGVRRDHGRCRRHARVVVLSAGKLAHPAGDASRHCLYVDVCSTGLPR
jgi:hypothetical protein